ncbi:MAG: ATP-binding cassette domain-containing protein [Bacilli bacterium]|jgi:ABC-type lipoprotein export system ATPase subunit/ABC-type antimicrobial peptide transport system permease subunit|nr:ATP-binding cassette domain-containing protein [Bacilli bacterium]
MLSFVNLTKRYPGMGKDVFTRLSRTYPDTGLFYLVGKSGCGKSTLLEILGGMDFDYEGDVLYNGKNLKSLTPDEQANFRFAAVSFSFQDYQVDDKDSVEQNLLATLAISSLSEKEKKDRVETYLKRVGLLGKKKAVFASLSGGEKKRVSLVRALIRDTPLLFADEPLSSLNGSLRQEITALLLEESQRRLVLVITHERQEIPPQATVEELSQGKLRLLQDGNPSKKPALTCHYQRKRYQGWPLIKDVVRALLLKKDFLVITLVSMAVALFSVSFSLLLSHGVNGSLSASFSQYMSQDSLVVTPAEEGPLQEDYQTSDVGFLDRLKARYPEEILATGPFYLSSLDAVFGKNQTVSVLYRDRSLPLNKLSMDSFLTFECPEELGLSQAPLKDDEIILGASEETLGLLYHLFFGPPPGVLSDEDVRMLSSFCQGIALPLRFQVSKSAWGYSLDESLTLKAIERTSRDVLIHTNPEFGELFLKNVLHFKDCLAEETIPEKEPWTLKKGYGIRLYPEAIASFIPHFLTDEEANAFSLRPLEQTGHYWKEETKTHNRFLVERDILSKISPAQINAFIKAQQGRVRSVCYSSPIFTFTASGYISGFSKPFFFSKYKDRLNQIEDEAQYSSENLGQFQSTLITVPDGVLKGDLLSSTKEDGLTFDLTRDVQGKEILGKLPTDYQSIAVSSGLATALYGSPEKALGNTLFVLTLTDTVSEATQRYRNDFASGVLTISGVVTEESEILYQDSFFPLAYSAQYLPLTLGDIRLTDAVLKVDLDSKDSNYYCEEIRKYGDYRGSFPMLTLVAELSKTMTRLSQLFLGFSLLSLLLASALMGLALYLILEKDRKEIGIRLALGFRKEEIIGYYLIFSLTVGLSSFLLSYGITLFAEKILAETLKDILSVYSASLLPYLISFGCCLLLSGFLGLFMARRIASFSPKEAFQA